MQAGEAKTLGARLAEGLAARGVKVVFGIPGVHTIELYRGLAGSGIRHVTARHEQGCGFMADGYARVTGKPGVALVITGPGLTNTLTAMAQARADSVPMLVISGVNRRDSLGKGLGRLHELPDQQAMVRALCPGRQIGKAEEVGPALDWAFSQMAVGRPGPVHLEVPVDVMGLPCPALADPVMPQARRMPAGIAAALPALRKAERAVILAGGGMRGGEAELKAIAEALDAPVVQTVNARGMMHGHGLVVPASPSLKAVRGLVSGADVVVALGTELGQTDYDVYADDGFPELPGMIRVDISAAQLGRHTARLALEGDAVTSAGWLAARLGERRRREGIVRAAVARKAARAELERLDRRMVGRLAMIEAIRTGMPGAVIVGDSTQPVYAGNLYYDHDLPGGWFNAATGFGALGYGPGAAVGAAIGRAGERVVCLVGDGGLQFSPGELRTAVDEAADVTFIVWNNAGFREIDEAMRAAGAEPLGCAPSPSKMEAFAAACDLPFISVPMEAEALVRTLGQGGRGPRMIEVRVTG